MWVLVQRIVEEASWSLLSEQADTEELLESGKDLRIDPVNSRNEYRTRM